MKYRRIALCMMIPLVLTMTVVLLIGTYAIYSYGLSVIERVLGVSHAQMNLVITIELLAYAAGAFYLFYSSDGERG